MRKINQSVDQIYNKNNLRSQVEGSLNQMSYFSIRCCSPGTGKIILLVINILIGCWGVIHFGYAGSFSIAKIKSLQYLATMAPNLSTIQKIKEVPVLTDGPLAYYAVTGVVAVVGSVVLALVVMQVIGKENRMFYFKLIAAVLVVHLLLEFAAAIYTTIMLSYYGITFQSEINMSQDLIDLLQLQSAKDYINGVRSFYRLSLAEVFVLWLFVVPSTIVMIFALFEEFFNHQEPEEPTKIAPERLQTEEKPKTYQKIQVQSFGVESFGVESFGVNKSQEFSSLKKG